MSKIVKRGYVPTDEIEFDKEALQKLHMAAHDLCYLINMDYPIKGASTFVGNHYLLSERQRLALVRTVSAEPCISARREKEMHGGLEQAEVHIDGFNTIITLEVAYSDSTLLKCMDGTIRDLAGLRGTYRLIDKTDLAIRSIGRGLERLGIGRAVFYLDAPVSNSGRLKQRLFELLEAFDFEIQVEIIHNVDSVLCTLDHVITSDAIILDCCRSWINLVGMVMEAEKADYPYVDFL